MSVCWLRTADGTLISQVLNPVVKSPCSFRRRGAGESVIDITHDVTVEPCLSDLLDASPTDGRFLRTWWDTDIELAWWRGSPSLTAETIPEEPPTWAGPIVGGGLTTRGFVQVRAWTQEGYVLRSVVGGTLTNYLITGGLSDYDFEDDTDLSDWTVTEDADENPTATISTTSSGAVYMGTHVALVEATPDPAPATWRAGMYAGALLPDSTYGNYAQATVNVYIPSGVTLWDPDGVVIGTVYLFEDGDLLDEWDLELPDGWQHDEWLRASVQVRQPPGPDLSYTFLLLGGNGGPVRFGRPRFTRPANVGAAAGADISAVPGAITDEQVDLVPALTADDVTTVGTTLSEKFRYFSIDHEDATSALGDWDPYGEWWVEEGTLFWAPVRGALIEALSLSSAEDLSGWGIEVDATGASTILYGQLKPETGDGPPDEVVTGAPLPNRLVAVEQIPPGMGARDSFEWCTAAVNQKVPVVSLTGVPARYTGLPGDDLASFMPGNWMDVEIVPLSMTVQPTVDAVSWHPVTDRVEPTWVLGGKARQDPLAMITAKLREDERRRRVRRPSPTIPGLRQWDHEVTTSTTTAEASETLPAGFFVVDVEADGVLDSVATTGRVFAEIHVGGDLTRSSSTGVADETQGLVTTSYVVKGPALVLGRSRIQGLTGAAITENTVTMTISRVTWRSQQ